jgi:hypothetical protein
MQVNKQRKLFIAVLALALIALVVDRVVLDDDGQGPQSANAQPIAQGAHSASNSNDLAAGSPLANSSSTPNKAFSSINSGSTLTNGNSPSECSPQAGVYTSPLSCQLETIAKKRAFDLTTVTNAFEPSANWIQTTVKQAMPEIQEDNKAKQLAQRLKQFTHKYRLMAVIHNETGGAAIVNNRTISVGTKLDGFKLVTITSRGAIFEDNDQQIKMKVATRVPN